MIKLRDLITERKVLSIFDFDDTLAQVDNWIYVKHSNGKESKLDPAEFAVYDEKPGDIFDFRDFSKILQNPKVIKKNVELLKKQLNKASKTPARKVTILTARAIGFPVKHFFKTLGLDVYVVAVGSSDPKKKSSWIEKQIKSGYTDIYFIDDSVKNVKAVANLKKKYPKVNIIAKVA
tara:strand:+ start:891 stop:1421 length:531 start_codon:yes stop_codon:yes gene_type:complete